MSSAERRRRQKPVKGGRAQVGAGVIAAIERELEREMRRYGVSRSFVIATALAFAFGIEEQEDYRQGRSPRGAPRTPLTAPHLTLATRRAS